MAGGIVPPNGMVGMPMPNFPRMSGQ
jgi:hypothetical protein